MTSTTFRPLKPPHPTRLATIAITGAAGQIAYALLPLISTGQMFGPEQQLSLRLLDIPPAVKKLQGIAMELEDGAYPLLKSVLVTTDITTAMKDVDYAILVGAFPRKIGMERRELLEKNAGIFSEMAMKGLCVAKDNCKVLVVGNPANTNAWILKALMEKNNKNRYKYDGNKSRMITALTRLDHNRVVGYLAKKFDVGVENVEGVYIWGNHSKTQFPDVVRARLVTKHGKVVQGNDLVQGLGGYDKLEKDFIPRIQGRGAAVIAARGLSSAMSAANAIVDHMRDWICGSDGKIVSMAVHADGAYGVKDVFFSYPVVCKEGGEYKIVRDFKLDNYSKKYIMDSAKELYEERDDAMRILASKRIANGNL